MNESRLTPRELRILHETERVLREDAEDNPGLHLGAALGGTQPLRDKLVFRDLGSGIAGFADWAEQLIAESTGKEGKGVLPVVVGAGDAPEASSGASDVLVVELVGNDHPGIIREISAVFGRHVVSIGAIDSDTREAPMAGGRLFEARISAAIPRDADPAALRADLEQLAGELQVDLEVADA